MTQPVHFALNGQHHDAMVNPAQSLLSLLRDELGLTGTKEGCSTGYCGACTVLIDGHPVNACLMLAVDCDRREITTIEGLERGESMHALQQAFIELGGLQCGYCTPGMIVSAAALLAETPDPSEDQIRRALAGNICRCTGYQAIVQSVQSAARTLREAQAATSHALQTQRLRSRA